MKITSLLLSRLFRLASLNILIIGFGVHAAEPDWQAFEAQLNDLRKRHQLPGMSVSVVQDGELRWATGFGFADRDNAVPVTANTPFWIASVTKTFVGLSFLHLEQQKKVSLDEKAADTPGFTDLCDWLSSTRIPFGQNLNCAAPITIKHILNHQVNFEPGTTFLYNPIMYSRLSRYLEHKFGGGIDAVEGRHNLLGQYIDQFILEPAGMSRSMSSMWDSTSAPVYQDMAEGFQITEEGYKVVAPQPEKHIAGGAGVVSTVLDLAKYEIALQHKVITPGNIATKLAQPATLKDGSDAPYGFGWYFQEYNGQNLMWHSGWDEEHGFSAMYLRIPGKNLAFIVLANSGGIWWGNPLDDAKIETSEFAQLFLSMAETM